MCRCYCPRWIGWSVYHPFSCSCLILRVCAKGSDIPVRHYLENNITLVFHKPYLSIISATLVIVAPLSLSRVAPPNL